MIKRNEAGEIEVWENGKLLGKVETTDSQMNEDAWVKPTDFKEEKELKP